MAIIKQGILGGFQNKIGSVVGTTWKGIAVMKAKPLSVANPRTAAQVGNRDRFANCALWGSKINATVIKPLWDRFAVRKSGYNAWVQYNIGSFSSTGLTSPQDVLISNGKMAATPINALTADVSDDIIQVEWVNDAGQGLKLASDQVYVVLYNVDSDAVLGFETSAIRSEQQVSFTMPDGWTTGDFVYAYLAFRRADGTVVSVSSVTGTNIVA